MHMIDYRIIKLNGSTFPGHFSQKNNWTSEDGNEFYSTKACLSKI